MQEFSRTLQHLQQDKYKQACDLQVEDSGHTVGGLIQIATVIVQREIQSLNQKNTNQNPRPTQKRKTEPPKEKEATNGDVEMDEKAKKIQAKKDPAKEAVTEKMQVEEPEEVVETKKEEPKKEEVPKPPPKPKIRQTAYQETDKVIKVFYVKECTAENVKIEFFEERLEWSITVPKTGETVTGIDYFWSKITPQKAKWTVNPYKVEVFMPKQSPGHWDEVFMDAEPMHSSFDSTGPYSTNTDWQKKQQEIEEELKADAPEGEAALMQLFQKIYSDSNEDTRRAMVKSYQTSGGTVLSTNWDDVKTKDYEGKDSVVPQGQIKKEWKDFI